MAIAEFRTQVLSVSAWMIGEKVIGLAGFKIGIKGEFDDYRDNALRDVGLHADMAHIR